MYHHSQWYLEKIYFDKLTPDYMPQKYLILRF